MKLQNLAVIFIIVMLPLILVLSYYIGLQQDTMLMQTEYDEKLISSTKESIEALEINTVEWNGTYSEIADSKRRDVLASINTFTTSLSNNLGITGTSKEYILNYIPAVAYTLYDGYYIYAPTYVSKPLTDDKGIQLYYYEDNGPILTTGSTKEIRGELVAGKVTYVPADGVTPDSLVIDGKTYYYTLNATEAVKEYKHTLKNYITYSETIGDVVVNYTLDNYVRIYSSKANKEAEGYLVYFDETSTTIPRIYGTSSKPISDAKYNGIKLEPETLTEQISYTTILGDVTEDGVVNEKDYNQILKYDVGENPSPFNISLADVNEDGVVDSYDATYLLSVIQSNATKKISNLKTYKYVYNADNEKLYYDEDVQKFFRLSEGERKYLSNETKTSDCEYKTVSILTDKQNYMRIYQALNGENKGSWYTYNDVTKKYTKLTADTSESLGLSSEQLTKDFSAISYYVEAYAFTNKINDLKINETFFQINENNNPEDKNSDFVTHKKEVMTNSVDNSLNIAIQSYSAYSDNYDYKLPELLSTDWEQAFSNISIITFFQGSQVGLKYYNNYAIATSTNNEEYLNPDELYYVGEDSYYHKCDCEENTSKEVVAYRNTEFKAKTDDETGQVYYMHDNQEDKSAELACYDCIINKSSFVSSEDASDSYTKARTVAVARERYKNNSELVESGFGETGDIGDLDDLESNYNYILTFPDSYRGATNVVAKTLAQAVAYAQGTYTEATGIKVMKNVDSDESGVVTISKDLEINTNGLTVQLNNQIKTTGEITIYGGGTIKGTNGANLSSIITNTGKLTVDSVRIGNTIDSENEANNENTVGITNESGTLTVLGGAYIYGKELGLEVNGGTVNIGTTDETPENYYMQISSASNYGVSANGGTVNFNGGYIRGKSTTPYTGNIVPRTDYDINTITDGDYTLALLIDANNNYKVVTAEVFTETLAEAVEAAGEEDEILLITNNYEDSSDVTIDSNITLNTNGNTLIRTKTITVAEDGEFTIVGSGVLGANSDIALITNAGTLTVANSGRLANTVGIVIANTGTMKKTTEGTIVGNNNAIEISSGTVTITKGDIIGNNSAKPAISQKGGVLNVQGGKVTSAGNSAVDITAGTIKATSGELIGNGAQGAIKVSNENTQIEIRNDAQVEGKVYAINALEGTKVTVAGGNVESSEGVAIISEGEVTVSGGTVSSSGANAIYSTGKVTVSGGTIQKSGETDGATLDYRGTETVNLTGGTIKTAEGISVNAIYNASTGTIKIAGAQIVSRGTGDAIKNNVAGTIEVTAGAVVSKNAAGIYNNATGHIKVTGGTVTGHTNGIYNAEGGKITLGSTSDSLSTTAPAVIGETSYGIRAEDEEATFNFYNGVVKAPIKSEESGTAYELGGTISLRPSCGTITKVVGSLYETTLAKICTVSFDSNGGETSVASKNVTFGSEYGLNYDSTSDPLPTPAKDGYTFLGWYLDDEDLIVDSTIVSTEDNHTLKAEWKPITYIVKYDKNSDEATGTTASSSHTYDKAQNLTANGYTYEGYRFKGWNTKADGTGTSYADKANVKNLSKVQNDVVTLYAKWEPITYTVVYDGNGATSGSTESSEHVYGVKKALTKNGYAKTGYIFTGWNTTSGGTGITFDDEMVVENLTVEESITIYAQWKPITYTIVYDGNGATSGSTTSSSHTYDVAKTLTENGYAKTGYIFKGWNTKKDGTGTSYANKASVKNLTTTDGATVTLYAKWGAIEYTVKYNGNGATGGSTASSLHTYDIAKNLTANGFTRTGYTFIEWNTEADGTGTSYEDEASVKNLSSTDGATVNLYAQWRAHTYTVVYDGNGYTGHGYDGDVPPSSSHTYDVAKTLTANKYTRTGYLFNGWNTKADGSGTSYLDEANVKNLTAEDEATVTLYAKWKPITYTVAYNGNESTGGSTASSTHTYDVAKNLTANGYTRTGYTFKNWNMNAAGTGTSYANKASVKNLTTIDGATVTLYAQWTINTSKLTVNPNTGSVKITSPTGGTAETITESKTYTQNYNTTLTYETPTKENKVVTEDFTVTYNYNYSGSTNTKDTATKTTTTKYTFSKWEKSSTFYGTLSNETGSGTYTYPPENNVTSTITAQFTGTDTSTTTSVTLGAPTRTGYTFEGWYKEAACTNKIGDAGDTYTPTASITLYAKWRIHTSTLKIDPAGGSVQITSPTGGTAETISAAKSYTQNYATKLSYGKPTRANLVETETFTVTYNYNGSGTANTTATATKTNTTTYAFSGWTKSSTFYGTLSSTTGSGTYTYPAEDKVTSTIVAGYTPTTTSTTTSVTLVTPTRTGYTFGGWYSESSCTNKIGDAGKAYTPTADITLYAKWIINTSKLTVNPNGGSVEVTSPTGGTATTITSSTTYTQNYNTTLTYAKPTKANDTVNYKVTYNHNYTGSTNTSATATKTITYTFNKWEKSDTFYGTLSSETGSGTYTYPPDNGVTSTITATYTSSSSTTSVTLETPTRTGYTFKGWYKEAACTNKVGDAGDGYTPTAAITLYAKWEIHTSNLTVNPNGGSVSITSPTGGTAATISSSKTYTQNYATTLTYAKPTKANDTVTYTVTYNHNYSGSTNTSATATKTITYAFSTWTKSSTFYGTLSSLTAAGTYTFPADNGVTSTITASYSSSSSTTAVTLPTPTREQYAFEGWYSDASCTNRIGDGGASYTPSGNITLYANWTILNYKVVNAGVYTETLAEAVTAAGSGETIKLLRDYEDSSSPSIGKKVTLDTNGNTLTKTTEAISVTSAGTLTIVGEGTLTTSEDINLILNRGTLNIEHEGTISSASSAEGLMDVQGTVNIKSGNIIQSVYPYAIEGSSVNITMSGGEVNNSGGSCIMLYANGNFTMNAGTLTGTRPLGLYADTAIATINGGTITGTRSTITMVEGTSLTVNSGTITSTESNAIYYSTGTTTEGTITINGGTIKGYGYAIGSDSAKVTITLGSESKTLSTTSPCIETTGSNTVAIYCYGQGVLNFYNGVLKTVSESTNGRNLSYYDS